ncbi:uncharacterized protein [Clytia hemisphaerica]|uniref:uncharacterized protein n=1 Tax=Clytia hemisphaerica TaxID=252671 RepID=UPI0034D6FC9C
MSMYSEPIPSIRRSKRLIEKQKKPLAEFFAEKLTALETELTMKIEYIDSLMKEPSNAEIVRQELKLVDNIFLDITYNHQKFSAAVEDPTKYETHWLEDIDKRIFGFKTFVTRWVRSIEIPAEINETKSRSRNSSSRSGSSSSSSSKKSHRSNASSNANKLIEAEVTLAVLEAESEFEKNQVVRDADKENGLAKEIAKQKARVQVYKSHFESDNKSLNLSKRSLKIENKLSPFSAPFVPDGTGQEELPVSDYKVSTPFVKDVVLPESNSKPNVVFQPKASKTSSSKPIVISEDSADRLCDLLDSQSAPEVSLDVFDGNPLEFHFFMSCFESVVETKIRDQKAKLILLIKYTSGEAKELIKGCIHKDGGDCYNYAKELLLSRFGDPYKILISYRKELSSFKHIKYGDSFELRKLYTFLLKCSQLVTGKYRYSFDNPENLAVIVSKLPVGLRERWNRESFSLRLREKREAALKDILVFVEKEATLASDPLFSKEAMGERENLDKPQERSGGGKKLRNFGVKIQCENCNSDHPLEKCHSFKRLKPREKFQLLLKKRICFACLETGHNSHRCKSKKPCSLCNGRHATCLHTIFVKSDNDLKSENFPKSDSDNKSSQPERDIKSETSETHGCVKPSPSVIQPGVKVKKSFTTACSDSINMCIVPIVVRHSDSKYDFKTYALLDSCSQGTFIHQDLLSQLSVPSTETKLAVSTLTGFEYTNSHLVSNLSVKGQYGKYSCWIDLPSAYSRDDIDVMSNEMATPESLKRWPYLQGIVSEVGKVESDEKVGLIIGANCPKALEPHEVIKSEGDGPYAYLTKLGWCVVGPKEDDAHPNVLSCHRIGVSEVVQRFVPKNQLHDHSIEDMMKKLYEIEHVDLIPGNLPDKVSQEDLKFLKIMDERISFEKGHYIIPFPFRDEKDLPSNNRNMAMKRLESLKRKLQLNSEFKCDYLEYFDLMLKSNYARKIDDSDISDDDCWYIPHHGVYHPTKNKIRVVFDLSAKCNGTSLNRCLLQGPDLTNKLIGVLTRFRENPVAVTGDIEKMFYQVKLPIVDRKYVRFLWWEDGNVENPISTYEMTVHPFGATSSPSVCSYALKRTAKENESLFGSEAKCSVERDFYVDDFLKSYPSVEIARSSVKSISDMCMKGSFHLTKFVSSHPECLSELSSDDVKSDSVSYDVPSDKELTEKLLGVTWDISSDKFVFKINLKSTPSTKRGMLSTLSSIYDPIGVLSPFLLEGKRILQGLSKYSWDSVLQDEIANKWESWKSSLPCIESLSLPRRFNQGDNSIRNASVHHFSDASDVGYGHCSYLRLIDVADKVHCSFLYGRSRVAPLKKVSTPRLELQAATLSSNMNSFVVKELDLKIDHQYFYSDSTIVLGYINNECKRFRLFVANRVSMITSHTEKGDWYHVDSKSNPADCGARGLRAGKDSEDLWFNGPSFLRELNLPLVEESFPLSEDDAELKANVSCYVIKKPLDNRIVSYFESNISSFAKMKRVLAYILLYIKRLKLRRGRIHQMKLRHQSDKVYALTSQDIAESFVSLVKMVQTFYFAESINAVKTGRKDIKLCSLNPFLDHRGILRVGGRLKHSSLAFDEKHPIILPKDSPLSEKIVLFYHEKVFHAGRGITLNAIRQAGLWILHLNSLCKRVIFNCVSCRKLRGKTATQFMSDLPSFRVDSHPPFSYSGVDLFGPYEIKDRRSVVKRHGVIFTCLASRAAHVETVNSLETDSFILALRRFMSRRGSVKYLRSDNGTNFVGADNEMKRELQKMDWDKVKDFLVGQDCSWVEWEFNPPSASHHGGVWERQIRSAKQILSGILLTHGKSLNDESLRTLLCEVENVLNTRPLTVQCLNDPMSLAPLFPSNLLTTKSDVVLPPPGNFDEPYVFPRRYWKRVQHLTNEFWQRWRKEFLTTLQSRTKWLSSKRNFKLNDIVLLKPDNEYITRNKWPLGRVTKVFKGSDNRVRSLSIKTKDSELERPITKVVLLLPEDSPPLVQDPNMGS